MTCRENITAILECFFAGFKEEIIASACDRILEQVSNTTSTDSQWVLIKDRLPDERQKVLLQYYQLNNKNSIQYAITYRYNNDNWYKLSNIVPIEWMIFPKPYIEVGSRQQAKGNPQKNERNCVNCEYSKDGHSAGIEECHLCMYVSQYKANIGHWIEHGQN